jgi:hypothetical protein
MVAPSPISLSVAETCPEGMPRACDIKFEKSNLNFIYALRKQKYILILNEAFSESY